MLQQPLRAPNSSCPSCHFPPLLLITRLSLLPRAPHPPSPPAPHLANSSSGLRSLVLSLRKSSLMQKDYPSLGGVLGMPRTYCCRCNSTLLQNCLFVWEPPCSTNRTWGPDTTVAYSVQESAIWARLRAHGLSLLHTVSAGAALPGLENLLPRWLTHCADEQGLAASSSLPRSFHRAV